MAKFVSVFQFYIAYAIEYKLSTESAEKYWFLRIESRMAVSVITIVRTFIHVALCNGSFGVFIYKPLCEHNDQR